MARTKAGQVIEQTWQDIKGELLGVGLLNAIGDKQGEHIRLQNILQMTGGKNRNGASLGKYKPATAQRRGKLGYQTGKVDLKRSGGFHNSIKASGNRSKITKDNTGATITIEITVPKEMQGRLQGFRTGKYGKHGRAIERPVVGMADPGTPLRTAQEKQLQRIAAKEIAKAFSGGNVEFVTRDT